jgi:hypothetical protein
MTKKPCIPVVELVTHYRGFKSRRRADGVLVPGPYRSQRERVDLAEHYLSNPSELLDMFERSVEQFRSYYNVAEALVGIGRQEPQNLSAADVNSGPQAAAFLLHHAPGGDFPIDGMGDYAYVDREVVPARTTVRGAMANCFADGTRSTRAVKADLLLRSTEAGHPTVGEVKVSNAKGDDADAFYGLVQALALATQLAGPNQRERLQYWYPAANFADDGPIDVLVLLFTVGDRGGRRTHRPKLEELAACLCGRLEKANAKHLGRLAVVHVDPNQQHPRFMKRGG